MGRASNRKKAQRRAGPSSRQAGHGPRADAATQQALRTLVADPPGGILPVGLAILSALAHLCRSRSASVLQPAA